MAADPVGGGPEYSPKDNAMMHETSGIERVLFGPVGRDGIDDWLTAHLRTRLGSDLSQVVFRSGRLAAVYGAALGDGRLVAVKVHRPPVHLAYLRAATDCQRRLAEAGYPCPTPIDGPSTTHGHTAVIETLVADGEPGDPYEPSTRRAMAHALFEQLELLRGTAVDDLVAGAPAWTQYEHGPWPQPHDPIFDFTLTPQRFTWLDDLARRAASILQQGGPRNAIAHADWTCGNVRFRDCQLICAYDWDSLAAAPEPVLAGLAAGSFTSGWLDAAGVPTPGEALAFLRDYEEVRFEPFSESQQRTAAAAITWVLAYNARCAVSFLPPDGRAPGRSSLQALERDGEAYLELRWS
ncbi:MAG: phosphotransferase [Chloroflexi bacterium]|nr:phosphotransferase [Chloroflexota bacterium]